MMEQYGAITKFDGISEYNARKNVDFMVDVFKIRDFMFYDCFYNYSQPLLPGCHEWETKTSQLIRYSHSPHSAAATVTLPPQHKINLRLVNVYIDQIRRRGGRSWLYVQAIAAEEPHLPGHQTVPHCHCINNHSLFQCYLPNAQWARRMCDLWIPFALYMNFDGIHWDQLGPCNGVFGDGIIFQEFLKTCHPILKHHGLLQTFNFVDSFGWDRSLITEDVLEFPYWEVWTLPSCEDYFFSEMATLPETKKGVFVCYPYGGHNPTDYTPWELVHARFNKCREHGCKYLMFADGNNIIKTEYFVNTEPFIAYNI